MSIWRGQPLLESINNYRKNTLIEHLNILITEVGDDFLVGTMPVDSTTIQPHGLLHGGASCVLAETLGSIAANLTLDPAKKYAVGLEINANHIRSEKSGLVLGKAAPLHRGRSTQIWEIKITNQQNKLVCISRLTLAIKDRPSL